MIETHHLKSVVIFSKPLQGPCCQETIYIYNNIPEKHGNVTAKDFRKYEKLEYKKNELNLDNDFLNNCKQFGVYSKFLIFKLPNVSSKGASSICKRLLRSTVYNRNKELQHVLKELGISKNFISKQHSTIDFYIFKNFLTSHNKKSLQKSLYTQHKKLSSLTRGCSLTIFTTNETITNLTH